MVIREGDDEKDEKKNRWFGRSNKKKKKSSTLSSSQYISRPPTASSYAKSTSTSTPITTTATATAAGAASIPKMNALGEEDLPPRLSSPTPQSHDQICTSPRTSSDLAMSSGSDSRATTPTGSSAISTVPHASHVPSTPGEGSDIAHIPKHAGFDLDAMRRMIGQAVKERPEELQVNAAAVMGGSTRSGDYAFASTKSSSTSILPSVVAEDERSRLAKEFTKFSPPREKEQGDRRYGGRGDFSSSSPSLPHNSPTGDEFDSITWGSSRSSTYLPPSAYRSSPTVSQPSPSSPGFSPPSFVGGSLHYNPFAVSSTTSLTFNTFNNSDHRSHSYGYHHNQFSANGGLSSGSLDGTIMSVDENESSGGSRVDAWVVSGDNGRQSGTGMTASGIGVNPWA